MLSKMFRNKKHFIITSLIILLFEGCALKYVRTEEKDILISEPSTLKIKYEFSTLSANITCFKSTRVVLEKKNFYTRAYTDALVNSSCCGFVLLPVLFPLWLIWPPNAVHTEQDTITRIFPLESESLIIKYHNSSKTVTTQPDGKLKLIFSEFGSIPLDENLHLQLVSFQLEDSARIIIPSSTLKTAYITEKAAEIDTVCFIVDDFQHSLILIEATALSGFNTQEGLGYIINGLEEYVGTKNIYDGMHRSTIFRQTYDELDLAVPKMSKLFNLFQEYLNYGKVISYISSNQFKEIWHEALVGDGKYAKTIITRRLEKPLKHDLSTIGLSDILINHIWFTILGGNYSHPFLNPPARRDSIVQKVFNELSNQ